MTRIFLLLFVLTLLTSCNENPECQTQEEISQKSDIQTKECPFPDPDEDPETQPGPGPAPGTGDEVPNEALIFDASVEFTNFDKADEDKVYKAIEIIKKVIGSRIFRDRVLNFTFEGEYKFVDNRGFTNEQIYQILLDGSEDLKPEVDHEMDLDLELYYSWRNVVGYTYPSTMKIFMNTKFFDPYTPSQVAGNIFHEWTHKLGFEHDQDYSVRRDSSVPYALGYLIQELGKEYE